MQGQGGTGAGRKDCHVRNEAPFPHGGESLGSVMRGKEGSAPFRTSGFAGQGLVHTGRTHGLEKLLRRKKA